jgi:hypothetical protein
MAYARCSFTGEDEGLMLRLLPPYASVRYQDRYTERWIQFRSPEEWCGHTRVLYRRVPFSKLRPAGSQTHIEVKAYWLRMLARAEPIPPLVACATPNGEYYLHDGNHRYCALADYFGDYGSDAKVRVALIEPLHGCEFAWHWFDGYGTYLLKTRQTLLPAVSRICDSAPPMECVAQHAACHINTLVSAAAV